MSIVCQCWCWCWMIDGRVVHINSDDEFATTIASSGITVVDFFATWVCYHHIISYHIILSFVSPTMHLVTIDEHIDVAMDVM
jgi:hypothetical protein